MKRLMQPNPWSLTFLGLIVEFYVVPQSGTMTKIFKTWQSVFKIQISNKLRESKSFGSLKKAIRT